MDFIYVLHKINVKQKDKKTGLGFHPVSFGEPVDVYGLDAGQLDKRLYGKHAFNFFFFCHECLALIITM